MRHILILFLIYDAASERFYMTNINNALKSSAITDPSLILLQDNKSGGISNNMMSVNNLGGGNGFPIKNHSIEKNIDISGDSHELHVNNQEKQAQSIASLFVENNIDIKPEMILKTMKLGHGGSLQGQELQYRPENTLIVLTLLDKDSVSVDLLSSAAKLIKHADSGSKDNDFKKVLNEYQSAFDKKINNQVSSLGEDAFEQLIQRFEDKYVTPAIKEKLQNYIAEDVIDSLPINDFLVDELNDQKKQIMVEAKNQLQQHKTGSSVDRFQQLNNIFGALEQKIEIIREINISIKTENHTDSSQPTLPAMRTQSEDVVDGSDQPTMLSKAASPSESRPIITNYYTTNNYNMPKDIVTIRNTEADGTYSDNNKPERQVSESVNHQSDAAMNDVTKPITRSNRSLDIQGINNDQSTVRNDNEPKEAPSVTQDLHQKTLSSSRFPSGELKETQSPSLTAKSSLDINGFLPKGIVPTNRFELVETVDTVTGKTKKTWQPIGEERKTVTLTTQGALTRNQAEKEHYANEPIVPSGEKMGIPSNVNGFSNRFKPIEVTDEATGKTRKTWQLSDDKTSQSVTLTEMGALTRNQAEKERYDDNASPLAKG